VCLAIPLASSSCPELTVVKPSKDGICLVAVFTLSLGDWTLGVVSVGGWVGATVFIRA